MNKTNKKGFLTMNTTINEFEAKREELETIYNEYEMKALDAIYYNHANNLQEAIDILESGEYEYWDTYTLEELAWELIERGDFGDIPESFYRYVDIEAIANDLRTDYIECENGWLIVD